MGSPQGTWCRRRDTVHGGLTATSGHHHHTGQDSASATEPHGAPILGPQAWGLPTARRGTMWNASPAGPGAPVVCCVTNGYDGCPTERVLRAIAQAGFRFVELSAGIDGAVRYVPERMGRAAIREARAQLRGYGLTPIGVS